MLYGSTEQGALIGGSIYRLDPRTVSLSIERQGAGAMVRWPVTGTSDALEQTGIMSSNSAPWLPASAVWSTNAGEYAAAVSLANTNRFLRVRREWK